MMRDLESFIIEREQDRSLDDPASLRQRLEILDQLEPYLLHLRAQSDNNHPTNQAQLADRARAIAARLETINHECYQAIRREIQRGVGADRLLGWAAQFAGDEPRRWANGDGYDDLDVLINGVMQFEPPDVAIAELAAEMVFYQPTPARHIFDLIERCALTQSDVLIDLGSGLGHVPLLSNICTGATSIGIEREAAYVACARHSASALHLTNVTFLQQDARTADVSSGTVFYLYTPFNGSILRDVLDSLRREANQRPIRICTYGPCTAMVARQGWLATIDPIQPARIAIFRSRD